MIGDLKPYAEYKDSGLPWLGPVPAHWQVRRIKTALKEVDRRSSEGLEPLLSLRMQAGLVDHHALGGRPIPPSALVGYKRVLPGEIVMNRMRASSGLFAAATSDGLVSPDYAIFRPADSMNVAYAVQLFKTPAMRTVFRLESTGLGTGESGFLRLYSDQFMRLAIPMPTAAEQAAIVRFLAWANGRLDRAIRAKRKVIALLMEQKHAIVHRIVTRGLDPTAPLKPSGVPWIDQIPRHWRVMPIKRTCSLVRDGTHMPPVRTASGFPLLSVRNMIDGRFVRRSDDSFISKVDFDQLNRSFVVRPGDVLLAIVGATLGKVAIVDDIGPFQIQRSVAVLRPRAELMTNAFLETFLRSPSLQEHLWRSVAFSAQPGIYLGFVANIPVPVPPTIEEQLAICEALQRELGPVDVAISRLTAEIKLLHEYGARLVSEVVTGKVDIRDAAARLPDETALNISDDLTKTTGDIELDDVEEAA